MRKQIKGFEDYWVDTEGRVWSVKSGEMKERTPKKTKKGYLRVNLCKNNKVKDFSIHRLVAMTFLDNPDNYPQVNHKNGIKTDNRVSNLEWCSGSQNTKHAYAIGLHSQQGSKHSQAKLSEKQAIEIFRRLDKGESPAEIAKDYPVKRKAICNMKQGRSWSHLKY